MSDAGPPSPRVRMTRERWKTLEPMIDVALELPVAERQAYIARVAAGDATLEQELCELIGRCEADDSLVERGAADRYELLFESPAAAGAPADLIDQLRRSLGERYTLDREMGGGGMSRVFVGTEHGLDRRVVIKVLTPRLAAGISTERFAREIRLAASLQQANIVPLLSAGTAAGLPFYTMPLVEGRSLRERLAREGPLPIAEATSVLRDVARALAYAHARGVVHRDIKPGNVLLSGGTAVVTDFGIAKALGDSGGASGDDPITQTGTVVGTPAYMAPEQATGDPTTDHRADLYAFGCLAYEIFTGRPPFHGLPPHRLIAAHIQATPAPVSDQRPDTPPALGALIAQCLEKDPARRPHDAAELLAALEGMTTPPLIRARRGERTRLAGGLALAAALAAGASYVRHRATPGPLSLAAVPFRNLAQDSALEYLSDGISDEILTGLARIPGVEIIGRSAVYRYKSRTGRDVPDVRVIERGLGVRLLVTGTLRREGDRLVVSAQLNDSMSRGELWAGRFDRDAKDLAGVTDEVVRTIADTLHSLLGSRIPSEAPRTSLVGTTNGEAHDAYLEGLDQLKHRGAGVRESVRLFEHALTLDPRFARAHAALATALQLLPFYIGMPPHDVQDRTISEANRALELDPTLADACVALAGAYVAAGRWQDARAEFDRAVALEPGNTAARLTYGRNLLERGLVREALGQLEEGRRIERVSPLFSAWLSYAYFVDGRTEAARVESERAVQGDSLLLPTINLVSLVALAQGRPEQARRLMTPRVPIEMMSNAPYVFARLGDTVRANALLEAMEANAPRPWFTDVARASVRLAVGDSSGALTLLERSQRTLGALWLSYIPLQDPAYDLIRSSHRFASLLRQADVDVPWITSPRGGRK